MPLNNRQTNKNRTWSLLTIVVVLMSAILLPVGELARAQGGDWTPPTVISTAFDASAPIFAWFPDIAIDEFGLPHVIWCQTVPLEEGGLLEQVSYTHWDGTAWTEPNDIVPPSPDIVRNAIASDLAGNIHLLFGGSVYGVLTLYHQKAPSNEAQSAVAWSTPHLINQGTSYMGDIAIDSQGVIHLVYDDILDYATEDEPALADILYRRSTNGGQTWSAPINLDPEPLTGSARAYLEIDSNDVIYVTWDEGWDRLRGGGEADHSVYTSSADGGKTWVPPIVIDYPDSTVAQLTVVSNGQGGVMLVWRATSRHSIYYQWSMDGGYSWGAPSTIPQIFARSWSTPFDMYDMAADSRGTIHLIVVGREGRDTSFPLGVYHLQWDGSKWLPPERLFAASGPLPEYPKIVVGQGNQLHAAWFTREGSEFDDFAPRQVWYSRGKASAPYAPVTPRPTATPVAATPTPSPRPKATPFPTLGPGHTGLPGGLKTESDDVLHLIVALSPVMLVVLIVIVFKTGWLRKLR